MLALILAAFAQHHTCAGGAVLSYGVQPDGHFACVSWSSSDFERDDTHPIRVEHRRIVCRRDTVPILELDGRSVRCIRLPHLRPQT